MERLTARDIFTPGLWICTKAGDKNCSTICQTQQTECEECPIQDAFNRLAAYEDTGLTPEEISTLQAENEQLRDDRIKWFDGMWWEGHRCPKCGATLIKNQIGDSWCSLVGCDYGLEESHADEIMMEAGERE